MKRFHELSLSEQKNAIAYVRRQIEGLLKDGFLESSQNITEEELNSYAEAGAMDAFYSEPSDMIVADIA